MSTPLSTDGRDPERRIRFGDFELRVFARQLLQRGRRIAIQARPFDLLVHLIEHRDRVVTHGELREAIWRGVHVDVTTVRSALHSLRRTLGDAGARQELIRTLPGVGFRFVAPIDDLAGVEPDARCEAERAESFERLFLGRGRFLGEARALLDDALNGTSRVLLLCGEAGIGKSRALERLAQLGEERGFRVLQGRCVESEGAPAFWPWIQMLRVAIGAHTPQSLLRALGESASEVAWMVPELRPFVREVPQIGTLDARAARFMLFDALTGFLGALADEQPLLLCIDDLHRADTASLALLQHVADELARTQPRRLALAGAYRDRELRAVPALAQRMAATAALPHAHTEVLHGLAAVDVAALVRELSGSRPSQAVVSELHLKTSGNPFFLHQILRVLGAENRLGELASARTLALELPRHVQDAICRQFQRLPEAPRGLIEIASVIGREFDAADLEAASGLSRRAVLEQLAPAVAAGVVAELGGDAGRFRFVHVLVADAIYARLPLDRRGVLHGRIARALEARSDGAPSADSAVLAHHCAHGASREERERAIGAYELAARWCTARGAFENAPGFLEQALRLQGELAPQDRAGRCRLLLQLGEAHANAGNRERAREALLSAAEIAQQQGLPEALAAAALLFAPDFLAIETGVFDPELVRLLEAALDALGEADASLRARLLARLGIALQWSAEDRRSEALCEEACAIASRADAEARQFADVAKSFVHFSLAEPERQLQRSPTGRGASASLDLLDRLMRVTSLLLLGRVRDADAEIALFAELAEVSRHPQARWYVDLMRSTRALMEGRFAEAEESSARYLSVGGKFGDRNAIQSFGVQSIMSSFDLGGVESREPPLRQIVATFPDLPGWRSGLVLFLSEAGRHDEARTELRRLLDDGGLERARTNEWYAVQAALAIACGELMDTRLATRLYTTLEPYGSGMTVVGYCSYCLGSTQRLLGVLAASLGEWDRGRGHFERAIATNAAAGAVACNGRVLFEYARMLIASGDHREGLSRSMQAIELAGRLGMNRLAARVGMQLGSIG